MTEAAASDTDAETSTILLVDDEAELRKILKTYLAIEKYTVLEAAGFEDMRSVLESRKVDLLVLDLSIAPDSSIAYIGNLRKIFYGGIIVLTGLEDVDTEIDCLEMGADDYIVKPCKRAPFIARVRSILRRARPDAVKSPSPNWRFSKVERSLFAPDGTAVSLTDTESRLVHSFVGKKDIVHTRQDVFYTLYPNGDPEKSRAVDVLISRLRDKLLRHQVDNYLIKTVHGTGYSLAQEVVPLD